MWNATERVTGYTDHLKKKDMPIIDTERILITLRKEQQHVKALKKELESIRDKANTQLAAYDKAITELENEQAAIRTQLAGKSVSHGNDVEQKNKELLECLRFITNANESEVLQKKKELKELQQHYILLEEQNGTAQLKKAIEDAKRKQRKYKQKLKLKSVQTESMPQQKMQGNFNEQLQTIGYKCAQVKKQIKEQTFQSSLHSK